MRLYPMRLRLDVTCPLALLHHKGPVGVTSADLAGALGVCGGGTGGHSERRFHCQNHVEHGRVAKDLPAGLGSGKMERSRWGKGERVRQGSTVEEVCK